MRTVLLCVALWTALPAFAKTAKKAVATKKATTNKKAAKPAKDPRQEILVADRSCAAEMNRGEIAAARGHCADLKPANDPVAVYWRLRLEEDPNDLRKGLCASYLKGVEPEPRLLLLAGRYQFSRGENKELADLVHLAEKLKSKGREIDTLKRLGKAEVGKGRE